MAPQRQIAESQHHCAPDRRGPRRQRAHADWAARLLVGVLAAVLAGAAYLIAVRGEALLLDLAAFSQRIFCF